MVTTGLTEPLKKLEASVQAGYPDLRLVVRNDQPFLRGSFPISHEGQEIDRFLIEISFPDGIDALPVVREIGGRIPRHSDRHVNQGTGDICTDVPELILLHGKTSLLEYLDGPIRNFFLSQLVFESGKDWPFGQWEHGKKGLIQAYGELLGVSSEQEIRRYLDCVSRKEVKGHWPCPCGNGEKLRKCHAQKVKDLRDRIPRHIAGLALRRLNTYG